MFFNTKNEINIGQRARARTYLIVYEFRYKIMYEFRKKIKKRPPRREVFRFVAKLGLEPRQTEPESVVLPLHHLAM